MENFYSPKPKTVFVHLEGIADLDDGALRGRVFHYLGGSGLVYEYSGEYRNCNVPLTYEEFAALPAAE